AGKSGVLGALGSSMGNVATVTGTNSVWSNSLSLTVGDQGSFNQLVVSNGGVVVNGTSLIGVAANASNNVAIITGSGSLWHGNRFSNGVNGSFNRVIISDGGSVVNSRATIGGFSNSLHNEVWVSGTGSLWSNTSTLTVGNAGSANWLLIT